MHDEVFKLGKDKKNLQFDYLDALFSVGRLGGTKLPGKKFRHLYVELLCERGEIEKLFEVLRVS